MPLGFSFRGGGTVSHEKFGLTLGDTLGLTTDIHVPGYATDAANEN